jgi:UDPglucose--hexose-1-phosphate uridylyltransferase
MSLEEVTAVAEMWREQFLDLRERRPIRYVQIFENKGAVMGCSNPHPHGQVWSSESVPEVILAKCATQEEHFRRTGRPLLIDYIERELERDERVIHANPRFVVVVPFWAVWPFEAMIIPRRPLATIAEFEPEDLRLLADAVRALTIRYDNLFATSFPYSAGMHQAPVDGKDHPGFVWHMPFYPPLLRSATIKKFMVGYEMLAEPQRDITPEASARRLKEVPAAHYLSGES